MDWHHYMVRDVFKERVGVAIECEITLLRFQNQVVVGIKFIWAIPRAVRHEGVGRTELRRYFSIFELPPVYDFDTLSVKPQKATLYVSQYNL